MEPGVEHADYNQTERWSYPEQVLPGMFDPMPTNGILLATSATRMMLAARRALVELQGGIDRKKRQPILRLQYMARLTAILNISLKYRSLRCL